MYNLICKLSVHSRHVPAGLLMGFWQLSVGRQLILETYRPLWQPNSWKSGWLKRTGSSYSAWTFYTLVLSPSRLVTTKADVLTGGLLSENVCPLCTECFHLSQHCLLLQLIVWVDPVKIWIKFLRTILLVYNVKSLF